MLVSGVKVLESLDTCALLHGVPRTNHALAVGSQTQILAQHPHSCLSMARVWDQPSVWQPLPGA